MKSNSKQVSQVPSVNESNSLRLVYKNEEVIKEKRNTSSAKEKPVSRAKAQNKLFVKEPLPLFDDYKFKYKDHDPL